MSELRFDGKVAIVTGAGNGLGRSHALLLASRGAKVVVNDLGSGATGAGKSSAAADKVVEEIKAKGGEAVANYDSVEDGAKIVQCALDTFKGVHIIVNNAGILRDTSFQKMSQEDWDLIYRVHVLGGFRVTHAAWNHMRDAGYGRIVFTASAAGIYGNFGQANYSMAKLGLAGMGFTLALEGKKKNVFVNTIAPIAGSRLTETVLPKEITDALKPEYVSPLVAWLCHESCQETGGLFEVGGGFFGKLRWERAEGKLFKLGRDITPEQVQKAWSVITDFTKSTHPTDVTSSMQPILGNLQSKAKGGNEFIDVDAALGYELPPVTSSYDERDVSLYALGVGAAQNPLDQEELQYVYEMNGNGFNVLPTFGVAPALKMIFEMYKRGEQAPGLNYGFDRVLHGEQYTEVKRPLPPKATLKHKAKIKDIWDKGKGAVVVTEITSLDADTGEELIKNEVTTFVRGAGGWGGDRGPSSEINVPPDRAPDATISEKISEGQAVLYRLNGDINPLHVDPSFAKNFGFDKPILHGLCTFGFAGRHVIKAFSKNDPRYFKSIKVRFSDSVFPGETLVTEMWKESDTKIVFRCKVKERDKVVISNAAVELYKEIPKPAPRQVAAAQPAAGAAAAPTGEPTSAEAFAVIKDHIERNPDLASQIQKTYVFKLSAPESAWTINLKDGKGSVVQGGGAADCTLEISDQDFRDMVAGKADAQKLYFGGKLKISGDIMASQKLMFLKKIDPNRALEVVKNLRGAGGSAAAPAAAASASGEPTSAEAFAVINDHIEHHGDLASQIQKVYLFKLSSPDSAWTIDLKNGKGGVQQGEHGKADCTLEISDQDFRDMVAGKADAQKLYFGGKLKIGGDIMASQKLMFLKKIDPNRAIEVVKKLRGAGGGGATAAPAAAAAAPAAPKQAKAPAIVAALGERLAKNPGLVKEVASVVQLNVTGPDGAWTLDLKNGSGSIKQGSEPKADLTIRVSDDDLATLAKEGNVKDAFQRGQLRVVSGDIRLAHRLGFFKGLV
jgi:3-hydroxyacyl-CoA dehydrogenase/3a,7a,12a-trihydroxy-5b-cholest-24-enoyl-CoA hydratase